MAEGVLLLLIGDENKKRKRYEALEKEYDFEMLCGIETDTFDVLGIITKITPIFSYSKLSSQLKKNFIPDLEGKSLQTYPPFSSFHYKGKPLFYWARQKKLSEIILPQKMIFIKRPKLVSKHLISFKKLLPLIISDIRQVEGDFRQDKILALWEKSYYNHPHLKFPVFRIKLTCSSGTYVRSLIHNLGGKLGTGAIALNIKRTKVGTFSLSDVISLDM